MSLEPRAPAAAEPASICLDVLLSLGRHGLTQRPRRADLDARALEMALTFQHKGKPGNTTLSCWHAGPAEQDTETALRAYLGMGLPAIRWMHMAPSGDALAPLHEALRAPVDADARLVLCGMHAEQGEGSGLLPIALAERLDWRWVPGVVAIEAIERISTGVAQAIVLQALPRGQRRRIAVRLPAILGVEAAAPAPRQSAFGPARRGQLLQLDSGAEPPIDPAGATWPFMPATPRPKRLKIVTSANARERFKAAAAKAESGSGRVLEQVSATEGATAILDFLDAEGVVSRAAVTNARQGNGR